jgi:transcriptional regulator with XRE-family HTH domain
VKAMITGEQIRAARKLLGWSRDRLAPRAGLPINRLGNYELGRRILPLDEVEALKGALEAAGVEFTNGDEPGVKLKATKARAGK